MYKIAGYIKEEISDGAIILTSELYESITKITDKEMIDEYTMIKQKGCKELKTNLEKVLHEQGVLIERKELDQLAKEVKEYFDSALLLTLMPTESCNFRCVYCYENHENVVMSRKIVNAIKKFLKNEYNHFEYVSISWFGGEPTICKEIILEINQFMQSITNNNKDKFESNMTTNGYLLKLDDFIKYYYAGVTSYQITIDGWNHDENRPLSNGKGSFNQIIENLDNIHKLSKEFDFNIMIRHNVLDGDMDFSWYDYLDQKYGDDDRFSILVRTVNDMGGENVKTLSLVKEGDKEELVRKHVDYIHTLKIRTENDNIDYSSVPGRGLCSAAYKNHFVIRPDGKVEKCTVALDYPENELGYLGDDGTVYIDELKNQKWSQNRLSEKCYTCNRVLSCMNQNCPMQRIIYGEARCGY